MRSIFWRTNSAATLAGNSDTSPGSRWSMATVISADDVEMALAGKLTPAWSSSRCSSACIGMCPA
ncbi:hypothetical protein D3C72_2390620 [compost metagenome]